MQSGTLILCRHGATELNLRRPFILQGRRIDPPLCELGRRQAEALAEALKAFRPTALYSSDLARARETAAWIGRSCGLGVDVEANLTEGDVGKWEGLTWDQIRERHPAEHDQFMKDPGETPYLGGESFREVGERARPAIDRLASSHAGQTWVVVSHNIVNRALLAQWLGMPMKFARKLPQANAGFNIIEFHEGKAQVRTISAAAHLSGLLPPD